MCSRRGGDGVLSILNGVSSGLGIGGSCEWVGGGGGKKLRIKFQNQNKVTLIRYPTAGPNARPEAQLDRNYGLTDSFVR